MVIKKLLLKRNKCQAKLRLKGLVVSKFCSVLDSPGNL